jgi:3-keto-5-aminohexanoate cleavage enzyme
MTLLVVAVAPNGARRTKADHPNLPLSPEELAADAVRCRDAGATLLHMHVRDESGGHSLDPRRYRAAIEVVRRAVGSSMVIQITTEAVGVYTPEEQMRVVREVRPEAVSLGLRELAGEDLEPLALAEFLEWMRQERIAPQYILYSPSDVGKFHELRRRGIIPQRTPFALFVLGRYTAPTEIRPRDVLPYLKAHDLDCPWALCAFGVRETACVLTAAGLGGHVRVGFENNLWLADGRTAETNADLVEQVCRAAPLLGRPLADITQTRALLAETAD